MWKMCITEPRLSLDIGPIFQVQLPLIQPTPGSSRQRMALRIGESITMAGMVDEPGCERSISTTLLVRLRDHEPQAWEWLTRVFGPLVYQWCRGAGLKPADAADVAQDVFRSVAAGLTGFRREQSGDTFRGWLVTITRNRIRDFFRRHAARPEARGGTGFYQRLQALPDPEDGVSTDGWPSTDGERHALLHRALELARAEFESTTWKAFWRTTVDSVLPADVALELGISANAVYKAKSRVLRRLREEFDGILD